MRQGILLENKKIFINKVVNLSCRVSYEILNSLNIRFKMKILSYVLDKLVSQRSKRVDTSLPFLFTTKVINYTHECILNLFIS